VAGSRAGTTCRIGAAGADPDDVGGETPMYHRRAMVHVPDAVGRQETGGLAPRATRLALVLDERALEPISAATRARRARPSRLWSGNAACPLLGAGLRVACRRDASRRGGHHRSKAATSASVRQRSGQLRVEVDIQMSDEHARGGGSGRGAWASYMGSRRKVPVAAVAEGRRA
jgi:hypothetical protein